MPLAGDPTLLGQIPVSHDPLQRISFQGFKPEFDLEAALEQTIKWLEDVFYDIIFDQTGINLRGVVEIVESIFQSIVDQISNIFGIDLGELGLLNPTLLLQQLLSFIPGLGGGTFDLNEIATNFIETILNPTGAIKSLDTLLRQVLAGIIAPPPELVDIATRFQALAVDTGLINIINVIDQADDTIQDWLNGLWAAFTGQVASGLTTAPIAGAQTSQTNVIAAIAAAVAKIEAQLALIEASDNFERVTTSGLGPNWQITHYNSGGLSNANIYLDGHQVMVTPSGFGGYAGWRCRWIGTNALGTTNNMKMQGVLGTPLTPTATDRPFIEFRCREDTTSSTATIARVYADNLVLVAQNSGVETVIGSPAIFSSQPGVGSNVTFECGIDGVGERQHRVTINNTIYDFSDIANAGNLGTSFRGRGFGMYAGSNLFLIQVAPGALAHWAVEDIGATVGTSFPYTLPMTFT